MTGKDKDKEPEGGWDDTPLPPNKGDTYTVRIVFHSASNLPIADLGVGASDPYVLAQLNARNDDGHRYGIRHNQDPHLRFRSATAHRTLEPEWEAEWIVAGVPANGFQLIARVYDEDNGTKDDRLGAVKLVSGPLSTDWKWEKEDYDLKKRGGSFRAWGLQHLRGIVNKEAREESTLAISAEVLGRTEDECGKMYTVNCWWFIHYAPLMGAIVGTTAPKDGEESAK